MSIFTTALVASKLRTISLVKRSAYGKAVLKKAEGPIFCSGPDSEVTPSAVLRWKADLMKCFELPPGKYIVSATVSVWTDVGDGPHGKYAQSSPVEFTVK